LARELGIETDTQKSKYGDGTTAWNSLPYTVATSAGGSSVEWTDVLNKPTTFTPSTHGHAISDITSLSATLSGINTYLGDLDAGKQDIVSGVGSAEIGYLDGVTSAIQTQLNGKAATSHTHAISDTTGLQTALDGKAAVSHTHTLSQITDYVAQGESLSPFLLMGA
jgi:hypothetical protein